MRESRYNVWVARDDVDYVYNGVTGALLASSSRRTRRSAARAVRPERDRLLA